MKRKSELLALPLLSFLFFTGCPRQDPPDPTPFLNELGAYVLVAFIVVVVMTLAIPFIQKTDFFKRLRETIKKPAYFVGVVIGIIGLIMAWLSRESPSLIPFFVSVVVCGAGWALSRWARAETPEKSAKYLKIVSLAIVTIIALLWLANLAADMLNPSLYRDR